jgi:hypothetical protein
VKGEICLTDCDIWWYKGYNYHFGWIPRYTQKISQIINHAKEVGVPFVALSPKSLLQYTQTARIPFYFDLSMKPPTPVMMDECFPERLDDNSNDELDYDLIDDGKMAG